MKLEIVKTYLPSPQGHKIGAPFVSARKLTHRKGVQLYMHRETMRLLEMNTGDRVAIAKLQDGRFVLIKHEHGVKLSPQKSGSSAIVSRLEVKDSPTNSTIEDGIAVWPAGTFAEYT